MGLLQDITAALAPVGLNLIGTTPRSDYEALVPPQYRIKQWFPETETVVVIGNGGGEFWNHFREYTAVRPGYLQQHEHPLDDYTVEVIRARLTPLLDTARAQCRLIYPFQFFSGLTVSFMHLAQAARLSVPSILGVQIHPRYGPWIAWRAAVLIDHDFPALSAPAQDFEPCSTCVERPCIAACPTQAVSAAQNWDLLACTQHRLRVPTDCAERCHARYTCVYGREHRYPEDELAYHQRFSLTSAQAYFRKSGGAN